MHWGHKGTNYVFLFTEASWNSVSTMAIADEETLPDDKKTPFDWCQDGKLVPLKRSIKQSEMDINETDELGKVCQVKRPTSNLT